MSGTMRMASPVCPTGTVACHAGAARKRLSPPPPPAHFSFHTSSCVAGATGSTPDGTCTPPIAITHGELAG
jgi:hypothetical protein